MKQKKHNTDVVAGYIEPHDRPDTRRQAEGLETIPPLVVEYKGGKAPGVLILTVLWSGNLS